MFTRFRKPGGPEAAPSLAYCCDLCETQGCSEVWKRMHIDYEHGGMQRYRNAFTVMRSYSGPHVPNATDKRATIQAARQCQEFATPMPETLIPNDGANWWEQLQKNVYAGAKELWHCVQQHVHLSTDKIQPQELKPKAQYSMYRHPSAHRPRQFEACVFCAVFGYFRGCLRKALGLAVRKPDIGCNSPLCMLPLRRGSCSCLDTFPSASNSCSAIPLPRSCLPSYCPLRIHPS